MAQINVRIGPGTGQASLGLVDPGQKVQVVGRDESGQWYAILFPTGPQGLGWVTAAYVQVPDAASLPVIPLGTPQETPGGNTARVTQRLNVRSGPGTDYNVLGTLEPEAVVVLTARNESGAWLQIEFAGGPNGRGWVTAAYVQVNSTAGLPVVDAAGTPVTPRPDLPTPLAATLTPTVGPAFADSDSSASPAVRVAFSPGATRQFTYTSDVSYPDGDPEDWVEFSPYASGTRAAVLVSLACSGNATLKVELWQNGSLAADLDSITCGASQVSLPLTAGGTYQFRLQTAEQDGLRYCRYSLTVRNGP